MMSFHRSVNTACVTAILVAFVAGSVRADELSREDLQFFETKIRPVLIKECYGCHSNKAGNVRGGLRLDTKELMQLGGSSGPAVVPGDLEESWLYNAITHQDFVMPPKRKLPQSVIDDFRQWIEIGAPDPRETSVAEIRSSITQEDIETAQKTFWAYQQPQKQVPPTVKGTAWANSNIDRFILAKLEAAELEPAADADPRVVLRRLCFDLIGLPPTPKQITAFTTAWEKDPQAAVEWVVDSLLKRDQFGEKWGRHWLDVVRFAESTGREVNMTYPHAWRYRDYVIDSFNNDKPYDQFVREQLAGDLLPVDSDEAWSQNLIATTFLAVGPKNVNEQNRVQFAADLIDEQIDATTRVFLGMSVACARCHDHKFDAIPQTDYYALAGIFSNLTTYFGNPPSEYGSFSGVQARRTSSLILLPVSDPNPFDKRYTPSELDDLKDQIGGKMRELADLRRSRTRGDTGNARDAQRARIRLNNELATLSGKLAIVDEDGNPRSYCMGVQERGTPRDVRLLVRGEVDQPAQSVPRGFPQVLNDGPAAIASNSSGRLELAHWIASPSNPLTARVMVNRIWQHLIGQGIVTSTENFGVTGQSPSHPKLLDYLAVQFIESGWSVKELIREIATTHTYRIQSTFNQSFHEHDPDNALVWRANPRRLNAEALRDAMLSISGEIDLERPRGSEVARAGYLRVQGGVLGNPRDIARRYLQTAADTAREQLRNRFAQGGNPAGRLGGGVGNPRNRFGGGTGNQRNRFGGGTPGDSLRNRLGGVGGRRPFGREGFVQGAGMQEALREAARKVQNQLDMEDASFRSVYLPIVRDEEPRSLEVFDFADSSAITGQRESSNTANQALYMMNNRFVLQQSQSFARRISERSSRPDEQVDLAFQLAYGRRPTPGERAATAKFIRDFRPTRDNQASSNETLAALCQSLFATAEFRYID